MSLTRRRSRSLPNITGDSTSFIDALGTRQLRANVAWIQTESTTTDLGPHPTSSSVNEHTPRSSPLITETPTTTSGSKGKSKAISSWCCSICLEEVSSPVVTPCGHLFCWEHIHEWLTVAARGTAKDQCPVCKGPATTLSVIPIYSVDGQDEDPRKKPLPPRPKPAIVASATPTPAINHFTFDAGLLGALSVFSMSWSWTGEDGWVQNPHQDGGDAMREENFMRNTFSRIFVFLFFAFFVAMTFSA